MIPSLRCRGGAPLAGEGAGLLRSDTCLYGRILRATSATGGGGEK